MVGAVTEHKLAPQEEARRNAQRQADMEKLLKQTHKLCARHRKPGTSAAGAAGDAQRPAKAQRTSPGKHAGAAMGLVQEQSSLPAQLLPSIETVRSAQPSRAGGPADQKAARKRQDAAATEGATAEVAAPAEAQGASRAAAPDARQSNSVECIQTGQKHSHHLDLMHFSSADELQQAARRAFAIADDDAADVVLVAFDTDSEAMLVNAMTPWAWLQRECRGLKLIGHRS